MATCPECDAEIEVDEFDVDKGDQLSCPECGSNLEVASLSPIELEWRETGDFEIRATFGAAQLIALVDVELIHFDLRIALRAGSHTVLGARDVGFGNRMGDVPESARQRDRDKCSDYSDNLCRSATRPSACVKRLRYLF